MNIEDAKTRDIRSVAHSLGITIARGKRKAYCPDHSRGPGDGTPSISFYRKDGSHRFKCHGCQRSGDVIDLVEWRRGCDNKQAVEWLTGINGTDVKYPEIEEQKDDLPDRMRIAACTAFVNSLGPIGEFGLDWLVTKRGINHETVKKLRITDIDKPKANAAMGAAIHATSVETCVRLGLAAKSKSSDNLFCPVGFAYHLAIPYLTPGGSVAHIQFRRLSRSGSDSGPKYVHLKGKVPLPHNLPCLGELQTNKEGKKRLFLVEGALDAAALAQRGLGALGIPGVGWLNKNRSERILRLLDGNTELVVGFDADKAGRGSTPGVVEVFGDLGADSLSIEWPESFTGDWCDWFREYPERSPEIVSHKPISDETWIGEIMSEGVEDVLAVASGKKQSKQVRTGYPLMDSLLEVQPGDMVVVAARPSTGKSHFVLSMMQRMATKIGTKSLFVSLEMSKPSVAKRISSAQMRLGQNTKLPMHELEEAAARAKRTFSSLPILVDFGSRKLDRVINDIRSNVKKHGIEMVVIDYLQLLENSSRSRQEEVAAASRAIKALSNELLVPIITVVQMNRDIERRVGSVPQMSDLRESGQIEQDADAILFVDRPFNRDPTANFSDFNVRIAKQRNGSTGTFTMHLPEPFGWLEDRDFDNRI